MVGAENKRAGERARPRGCVYSLGEALGTCRLTRGMGAHSCQLRGWAGELPSTAGSWRDQTVPNLQLEVWCAAVEYVEYVSRSENSSPRRPLARLGTRWLLRWLLRGFSSSFPVIGCETEGLEAYASFIVDLVKVRPPASAQSTYSLDFVIRRFASQRPIIIISTSL